MAQNSNIEWTHHTGNLWWGCQHCSSGCFNCYAELIAKRLGFDIWDIDKPRLMIKSVWSDLAKYQKLAKEVGEIHRVFVGSMMDIFEKPMPLIDWEKQECSVESTDILRQRFFSEVVSNSPNLQFLLLTKRPTNINKYIPDSWKTNPPENVVFGTSPVDQATFDTLVR